MPPQQEASGPRPYEIFKRVPLFADLPDDDLESMCVASHEVHLAQGQQLFAEGDLGDAAYVVRDGTLEVVKSSAGRDVLLNVLGPGAVVGEMALIEHNPRMASVNARTEATLLSISKEQLDHLLETSLPAVRAMFYTTLHRWRATEALLRQGEKMAQLGTLTAGVAHELNNPAAAVRRGASQLDEAIARYARAEAGLAGIGLDGPAHERVRAEGARARTEAGRPIELTALERSDREAAVEGWLEEAGSEEPWEEAPSLVALGHTPDSLAAFTAGLTPEQALATATWVGCAYNVHNLLAEVHQGAERISGIVGAMKSYSYLDQAPVLDDTLLILRSKLKGGVEVRREYASDLPHIQAYGSELNQVWTNLIDNAADAMEGQGHLTLRTRTDGDAVVVEVEDDGPGIPPEHQGRVFDTFFTTKPPGKGTGLGLDITYNIVVMKHRGDIRVASEPGRTVFTVRLPRSVD